MKLPLAHLAVLIVILVSGVAAFFLIHGDSRAQLSVGIATSVAYVAWGLIHHAIAGDLHKKIVVEYLLVGAVAILVLINVLRP